jgi:hypothetical protein
LKFIIKLILFSLWFIVLPIIIILANYRFIYFIDNFIILITSLIFIIAFLLVFSISLIIGLNDKNNDIIKTEYVENPARKLFDLAQKYHLDLEINDALKIYDEIKEKYPNSIYEKEAQIEIDRIKRNNSDKNDSKDNVKLLQILKIKYARGEISKQEFIQKKKDLDLK